MSSTLGTFTPFFMGAAVPNGSVAFKNAGLLTNKNTYTTSALSVANSNPLNLDANGRCTAFLESGAYDVTVYDGLNGTGSVVYTVSGYEGVGQTAFDVFGTTIATGATSVTSGYTVLATDNLVTVNSTGGANPCIINLPAVSARTFPIAIKNLGTIALAVTPNGTDTIDTINAAYTVDAASSPSFPCIWLWPNGASGWYVIPKF